MTSGNGRHPEPAEHKAVRVENEPQEGTMTIAKTMGAMSPELLRVKQRAKRDRQGPLRSLAHLIDEQALMRAYGRLRKDAAVGVDGISKEQYGQDLEGNVRDLHDRLRTMRWKHQPIRRVHIPKGKNKTRPIGVSSTEDKVVQAALREVLDVAYEPAFYDGSYGFRPGRRAHDALRALDRALFRKEVSWVVEADIQSFFDSIDRKMLMEMLRERIADQSFLRLVGKCLHVGVLEGEEYSEPEEGTAQGSVLSPILGNVYLHHVLDQWFERDVRPRLCGKALLVRYADDFVIGCELREDAEQVMAELFSRFAHYRLTLHPEKTRLLPFGRPERGQRKGPATFDFLGFTLYWRRSRAGHWVPALKTRRASLRKAIAALADWCRSQRHEPVKEQHAALVARIRGHDNYFAVNGNFASVRTIRFWAVRNWYKWLNRRGSRTPLTWKRFGEHLLRDFPLPKAQVRVKLWATV
jgi:group II intron reverse transcriptase/maturase